jgi:hypothetical protein
LQFTGERRRGRGVGSWKFDRCDVEIKYGMYRTGTRGKITKNRLLRNCLKARSYEGIYPEAVPLTKNSTSMRIRKISFGNGQGCKKNASAETIGCPVSV